MFPVKIAPSMGKRPTHFITLPSSSGLTTFHSISDGLCMFNPASSSTISGYDVAARSGFKIRLRCFMNAEMAKDTGFVRNTSEMVIYPDQGFR